VSTRHPGNAVIIGIVAVVIVTILSSAMVLVFAPGTDVAPLVGLVAPTVAALASFAAVQRVGERVQRVEKHTDDLANGKMDAKIRAGVADVIPDRLLDETYTRHQLAADRIRARSSDGPSKDDPIT